MRPLIIAPAVLLAATATGMCVTANSNQTKSDTYKAAAGPYEVATTGNIILHDGKRNKDLPVFVSYPKGDGKFPVIIFSHGAMGSGDMGFPIVVHWTRHGYVVFCPTHADSMKLRKSAGTEGGAGDTMKHIRDSGRSGGWDDNWTQRPRDVSFVIDSLDELETKVPDLKGRLDRERIGVGGHSLGAYTAQVAGGATVKMPGNEEPQRLSDPRLKAILQLSGQGTEQQGLHRDSWKDIHLPMMCVTGSLDRAAQGQDPMWRKEPFSLSAPGDKYFVFIEGAHHGSFCGKMAGAGGSGGRLAQLTLEKREEIRDRFKNRKIGQVGAEPVEPANRTTTGARSTGKFGGQRGGLTGTPGDPTEIFQWVKQATMAFWDAGLKGDAAAGEWLQSDKLATQSGGKAWLERR